MPHTGRTRIKWSVAQFKIKQNRCKNRCKKSASATICWEELLVLDQKKMNLAKLKKTPTYNIMLSFIFLTLGNGLLLCLVQIKSFLYSLISCQNSLTYFHQWRIRWMMEKKLSLTEIDSYWINNVTRVTTAIHGVNHNS